MLHIRLSLKIHSLFGNSLLVAYHLRKLQKKTTQNIADITPC